MRGQKKSGARWREIAICIFLAAITWAVFGQTLGYDFVNYDDKTYVYGNSLVTDGFTATGFARAFVDTQTGNWHPLTIMSHMLDVQFYDLKAGGHHFTNVLLHIIAVLLLFFLLCEMTGDAGRPGTVWRSAFVAAIFAIHPLRVESVAWIAERKDVLSGLFFMLTLGAYLLYVRRKSIVRYVVLALLFACGLMSKPMLVTVPFVLLLLDYWPLGRSSPRRIRPLADQKFATANPSFGGSEIQIWLRLAAEKVPLLILSVISSVITFVLQEHSSGSIAQLPIAWRIGNAVVSYCTYIWQILWPVDLTVFYPHPENHLALWQVVGATALLVAISVGAFALHKTRPYLLVGWLWYLLMLLPVIGLVEVGLQGHADRYTYLPQIGLYIAVTWLMGDLATRVTHGNRIFAGGAALIVVTLSACAWKQTSYWRNSETLWHHALAVTQDNDVAHTNLGILLMDRREFDDALANFQSALEIRLKSAQAASSHYDLSLALIQGDIGNVLAQKGQLDDAIVHLRKAVEFQPDYADAHYNLGTALFQKGELDEAVIEWQKTLSIRPNDSGAHTSLGNAFAQKRLVRDAIQQYHLALQSSPQSVLALNNLAWVLATSPDASIRNGAEGVVLAGEANRYSGNRNAMFIRTLAAAYAEVGRFDDAVNTAHQAAEVARVEGPQGLAIQLQGDVDLYRRHIPLRDESLNDAR